MKNRKSSSKRALFSSFMSLILCFSMFIGATFAWFTDSSSTNVNTIQSGTLDVMLVDDAGNSIEGQTLAFQPQDGRTDILWEPNATYELPAVYIKNNGNLALKYRIEINAPDRIPGQVNLQDVLTFTVNDGTADLDLATYENHLSPNTTSGALTISGHMLKTAGNEYMNQTLDNISITVYATQYTEEYDSYGNQYDAEASLDFTVASTAEELLTAIAAGEDVTLTADITLPEQIEVIEDVTIQGNGYTLTAPAGGTRIINATGNTEEVTISLSGVDLQAADAERALSIYSNDGTVNLVLTACSAEASHYALNIAAENADVNVTVKGSTIEGYCAFQNWSAGTTATFEDCTLIGDNQWSGSDDDFATIVLNEGADNSVLNFVNCRIEANASGDAFEYHVIDKSTGSTINFVDCTYFVDGVQVSAPVEY